MNTSTQDLRNQIRTTILSSKTRKRELITLFGAKVEVCQPSMDEVLDLQTLEDSKKMAAHMIINYVYVPGTNEKVFEEADVAGILELPFGEDLARLQEAITKMTSIDVKAAEGN